MCVCEELLISHKEVHIMPRVGSRELYHIARDLCTTTLNVRGFISNKSSCYNTPLAYYTPRL